MAIPAGYEYQSAFAKKYIALGEKKGKAKGLRKGEQTLVFKLLTLKFRELPRSIVERIETATVPELELWAERVLFAKTLEDVFRSK